jgi:hypothetical protein
MAESALRSPPSSGGGRLLKFASKGRSTRTAAALPKNRVTTGNCNTSKLGVETNGGRSAEASLKRQHCAFNVGTSDDGGSGQQSSRTPSSSTECPLIKHVMRERAALLVANRSNTTTSGVDQRYLRSAERIERYKTTPQGTQEHSDRAFCLGCCPKLGRTFALRQAHRSAASIPCQRPQNAHLFRYMPRRPRTPPPCVS